jgi:hypothetical protein
MEKLIQYQPYLKYGIMIFGIIVFAIVNSMFIRDEKLRRWWMASLEENSGKASGKALTGFAMVQVLLIALLASIMYSPNHLMPDYMFQAVLLFVGSLYSIKLIGKYGGKLGSFNSDTENNINKGDNDTSDKK